MTIKSMLITTQLKEKLVWQILIDTGSSINILFDNYFQQMKKLSLRLELQALMENLPMPRLAQPQSKSKTKTSFLVKKSHTLQHHSQTTFCGNDISLLQSNAQARKKVVNFFGHQLLTQQRHWLVMQTITKYVSCQEVLLFHPYDL